MEAPMQDTDTTTNASEDSGSSTDSSTPDAQRTARRAMDRHGLRRMIWKFLSVQGMGPWLTNFAIAYQVIMAFLVVLLFVIDSRTSPSVTTIDFHVMQFIVWNFWAVEYVLRLWCCVEELSPEHIEDMSTLSIKLRCIERLRILIHPLMLLDLLALAALLADLVVERNSFRGILALRLLSLCRIERDFHIIRPILGVVFRKRDMLAASLAMVGVMVVVASVCMFYIESESSQDQAFGSIADCMWWACITMSTVGYGDRVPETTLGRLFASVIALLSPALVALPAGIIASGFQEELAEKRSLSEKNALDDGSLGQAVEDVLGRAGLTSACLSQRHGATLRKADLVGADVAALRSELRDLTASLASRGRAGGPPP